MNHLVNSFCLSPVCQGPCCCNLFSSFLHSCIALMQCRCLQVAIVVFAYSTVFLRTGLHPDGINDGQKYLAALFFTTYFLNASAW